MPPHPIIPLPVRTLFKHPFSPSQALTRLAIFQSSASPRAAHHETRLLPADGRRPRVLGLARDARRRRGGGSGGGAGDSGGAALLGGLRQGDVVPGLRAGEGGGAVEAVLRVGGGDKGERPGVPLLLHRADPQREQPHDQEHEHPGVPPPPAPLRLQPQELQRQRLPQASGHTSVVSGRRHIHQRFFFVNGRSDDRRNRNGNTVVARKSQRQL